MARLSGSSDAARDLQAYLTETMGQLRTDIDAHVRLLGHLAESCRDDSYQFMEYVVQTTINNVKQMLPGISEVRVRLSDYIDLVESIEDRYSGGRDPSGMTAAGVKTAAAGKTCTNEMWHLQNEGLVFDSPASMAQKLDIRQGKAGPTGTCGLCSVENVGIMAGKQLNEAGVVNLARNDGLCTASGGTSPDSRQKLLEKLGISSHQENQTIDNIAAAVMSGRGVILSVDANKLYGRFSLIRALHAVTVTSVTMDSSGNVTEITICDSNAGYLGKTGAMTYPAGKLKEALTKRPMNVTEVIR